MCVCHEGLGIHSVTQCWVLISRGPSSDDIPGPACLARAYDGKVEQRMSWGASIAWESWRGGRIDCGGVVRRNSERHSWGVRGWCEGLPQCPVVSALAQETQGTTRGMISSALQVMTALSLTSPLSPLTAGV